MASTPAEEPRAAPRTPRWRVEFYHAQQARLATYGVDAPTPAAAVVAGRTALCAQHPAVPSGRRPTLLERADRVGGGDGTGWVLYRIGSDVAPGSSGGGGVR
jgi:hypothetical protein